MTAGGEAAFALGAQPDDGKQDVAGARRRSLIDPVVAAEDFTDLAYAGSHGAFHAHLGAGLLYYALGALVRSQVSVCIGSGGGFVPALMRRVQVDAGITPSVTYLVDANLPDLAFGSPIEVGGWMTEESDFLERENDIRILSMLSVDAAKLFALERIRIDHLHIDGDHSSRGVLADFEAFAGLLGDHAIITLHDLRMTGVAEAVAAITGRHRDIQVLTFPEVGAGTGVMRRTVAIDTPRRSQRRAEFVDPARKVGLSPDPVRTATDVSQRKALFERWSYLDTATYQLRYKLAAEFIDQPDRTIVEIGGYPNSIVGLLRQTKTVHLIEPYAPSPFIEAIKSRAAERAIDVFIHPGNLADAAPAPHALGVYNLVVMGLDLNSGATRDEDWTADFETLLALVSRASRAVLETAGYSTSQITFAHLLKILRPKIISDITLDLSKDPVADSYHVKDGRAVRRLVVMEVAEPVDLKSAGIRSLVESAAKEISLARTKAYAPVKADYHFGTTIGFEAGGLSILYTREGWAGPEKRHRWMVDEESRLVLSVVRPAEAMIATGVVRLVVNARPLVVKGKIDHQTLVITVNGEPVHEGRYSEQAEINVAIPAPLFFKKQPARITFLHPDARRPCDLVEGSQDRKVLSFAVSSMLLTHES